MTLLERDGELSRIERELGRAVAGAGGLVTIEGPPGIGKTQLLRAAGALAVERGVTTLAGAGDPSERGVPYAAIRHAFTGALRDPSLAPILLAGRAAEAAPLLEGRAPSARSDDERTVRILDGLFWATVNLCERKPLLLAIDDGHWVDPPSLRFLAYLTRRLEGLPALVLYAHRPGGPGLGSAAHEALLAGVEHRSLHPAPLGPEATAELVGATLGAEPDEAFCRACYRASAGNPLLVRELLRALAARDVQPSAAAVEALADIGPAAVARTVRLRLSQLPADASRLAEVAAVAGEHMPLAHAATIAALDPGSAAVAASELHRAEILAPVAHVSFVHPLVRDALAEGLEPLQAAAVHERAAELLHAEGAAPEAIARHLLHAPPRHGERWRVETLRAAARGASAAGDAETATAYLRRALAEPPPIDERATVLTELAAAAFPLEFDATVAYLQEALPLILDHRARAAATAQLAGMLETTDPNASVAAALEAIEELGDADGELRRQLLAVVTQAGMLRPEPAELPRDVLAAMRLETEVDDGGARLLSASLTYRDAWMGMSAAELVPRVERAFSGDWVSLLDTDGGPHTMAFLALLITDSKIARRVVEEWVAYGRRSGSRVALGGSKMFSAHLHLARGELEDAAAETDESLEMFGMWGMPGIALAHAVAAAAGAAVARGDLDGAARALERATVTDPEAGSVGLHGLLAVRAELRAAAGETRVALAETLELGRRFEALGGRNPGLLPWRSRAALLIAQLGEDLGEARALAAAELELARAWGTPRAIGRALTAVGSLQAGERATATLDGAVAELERAPAPLELTAALIALGGALSAAGRASDARPTLRRALDLAA
ncbi:MAG: AAA family ATPase, partial [Solirubrobacteraceae bacterium]|nr:AAA family ATPase [Solirubrobacteraceae bacterium]